MNTTQAAKILSPGNRRRGGKNGPCVATMNAWCNGGLLDAEWRKYLSGDWLKEGWVIKNESVKLAKKVLESVNFDTLQPLGNCGWRKD